MRRYSLPFVRIHSLKFTQSTVDFFPTSAEIYVERDGTKLAPLFVHYSEIENCIVAPQQGVLLCVQSVCVKVWLEHNHSVLSTEPWYEAYLQYTERFNLLLPLQASDLEDFRIFSSTILHVREASKSYARISVSQFLPVVSCSRSCDLDSTTHDESIRLNDGESGAWEDSEAEASSFGRETESQDSEGGDKYAGDIEEVESGKEQEQEKESRRKTKRKEDPTTSSTHQATDTDIKDPSIHTSTTSKNKEDNNNPHETNASAMNRLGNRTAVNEAAEKKDVRASISPLCSLSSSTAQLKSAPQKSTTAHTARSGSQKNRDATTLEVVECWPPLHLSRHAVPSPAADATTALGERAGDNLVQAPPTVDELLQELQDGDGQALHALPRAREPFPLAAAGGGQTTHPGLQHEHHRSHFSKNRDVSLTSVALSDVPITRKRQREMGSECGPATAMKPGKMAVGYLRSRAPAVHTSALGSPERQMCHHDTEISQSVKTLEDFVPAFSSLGRSSSRLPVLPSDSDPQGSNNEQSSGLALQASSLAVPPAALQRPPQKSSNAVAWRSTADSSDNGLKALASTATTTTATAARGNKNSATKNGKRNQKKVAPGKPNITEDVSSGTNNTGEATFRFDDVETLPQHAQNLPLPRPQNPATATSWAAKNAEFEKMVQQGLGFPVVGGKRAPSKRKKAKQAPNPPIPKSGNPHSAQITREPPPSVSPSQTASKAAVVQPVDTSVPQYPASPPHHSTPAVRNTLEDDDDVPKKKMKPVSNREQQSGAALQNGGGPHLDAARPNATHTPTHSRSSAPATPPLRTVTSPPSGGAPCASYIGSVPREVRPHRAPPLSPGSAWREAARCSKRADRASRCMGILNQILHFHEMLRVCEGELRGVVAVMIEELNVERQEYVEMTR